MSDSQIGWNFEELPGFGVQPSDEQLVNFYLKNKMLGFDLDKVDIFPVVDVCMYEPGDLIELSRLKDQPWHFYSSPKRKYKNSNKAERSTKTGYWKVTGKDCIIIDEENHMQIGIKKTLVFHQGRFPNGKRTNWVMNEYHSTFKFPNQMDLVLCKVKKKHDNGSSHEGHHEAYETGNSSQNNCIPNLEDQFSSLMSSNDDDNVAPQDEHRLQDFMEELGNCVGPENYAEETFEPYNQLHQESSPYYDGANFRWP